MANVLADALSRLPLARACEAVCETTSSLASVIRVPRVRQQPNESECSNNFDRIIDADDSAAESGIEFDEFGEIGIEFGMTDFTYGMIQQSNYHAKNIYVNIKASSFPVIKLPISREGISENDFVIPTEEEMASAQKLDPEIGSVRQWIEKQEQLSADQMAALSTRLKCFAELLGELLISTEDVMVRGSNGDIQQTATIVPNSLANRIIRFYQEGPGCSHHSSKATTANIASLLLAGDEARSKDLHRELYCMRKISKTWPHSGRRVNDDGGEQPGLLFDIENS